MAIRRPTEKTRTSRGSRVAAGSEC